MNKTLERYIRKAAEEYTNIDEGNKNLIINATIDQFCHVGVTARRVIDMMISDIEMLESYYER